ncbi:hypothetical protein KIK84_07405 [Curvibacter sp. CHRR-16]|nr:hypothetical protein [Curvibacter sp. CHRR-16]MBT0570146.1 hypothetical protein [Curvibacter sp. CHRR-16]
MASAAAAPAGCDALAQRLRTTSVTPGGQVSVSDEYTPTVVAPQADGSTVLAWTDSTNQKIGMAKLSATDTLSSTLPGVAGLEVHDILTVNNKLALAVMSNDADIYSSKYCKGSATPDNAVCGKMDLVLLNTADGSETSRTTLTKKGNVDSVGAQFIWWYGHTARLATDGQRVGVYYRSAMSTERTGVAGEVDIHAGDTFKFVNATTGALQSGGWDWGCSHSWSVRLGYNGTWGAACHGDGFPNSMQVARLSTSTASANNLQWLSNTDPATRALGGMVPVTDGFMMNYLDSTSGSLKLKLAKVPNTGTALTTTSTVSIATNLDSAYPFRPYMAKLGTDRLLLGWKSAGKLVLAVARLSDGVITEGPVTTSMAIDNFQEFVTTAAGDVLWANTAGGSTVKVNRVAACKL